MLPEIVAVGACSCSGAGPARGGSTCPIGPGAFPVLTASSRDADAGAAAAGGVDRSAAVDCSCGAVAREPEAESELDTAESPDVCWFAEGSERVSRGALEGAQAAAAPTAAPMAKKTAIIV